MISKHKVHHTTAYDLVDGQEAEHTLTIVVPAPVGQQQHPEAE